MNPTTEQKLGETITDIVKERRTSLANEIRFVSSSDYVERTRLAKERNVLFRSFPLAVTLSCRLPSAHDFVTENAAGLPIIVVRGEDGMARAFVNACRHRGNTVCTETHGNRARFVCGYHAWTYGSDGSCRFSDPKAFAGLDPADFGLIELPSEERHGFVWVVPTVGADIDIARYLGAELDAEIESFQVGKQVVFVEDTLKKDFNWKLGMDSFQEVYHLNILHKKSLTGMFNGLAAFEPLGRHYRFTPIRTSFDKAMRDGPVTKDLLPHTSIVYLLFPNTLLIWQMDHIELWHIYPAPDSDDRCIMRVFLVIPEPADERATRYWNRNWEVLQGSVWKEDFDTMKSIYDNLATGVIPQFVLGRNEFALQHYHEQLDKALDAFS